MANKKGATVESNEKGLEISGTADEITSLLDGASKRIHNAVLREQLKEAINDHLATDFDDDEQENDTCKVEITGAKLNGSFCNYSYDLTIGTITDSIPNRKGGGIVHSDLSLIFTKLGIHLGVICERIDKDAIKDIDFIPLHKPDDEGWDVYPEDVRLISEDASHFTVHAFEISGTGEKEGVILIGEERLSTGDYVSLKSPKKMWAENDYKFINELRVLIDDLKDEVKQYKNGKHAPRLVQQEMNFGEGENGVNEKPEDQE
jgi:hypothetical protein